MAPFPLSAVVKPASLIGVLDVGASFLGEPPPYQPLLAAGMARLVGFEPNAAECEKLRRMYPPPNAFFPYYIGDGSAATFYETNWSATGSLYRPNRRVLEMFQNLHEKMTLTAEHQVQTRRLDDIEGIGDVDYLKLDIQGAELMALQNAERILQRVSAIQVEVEFIELYERQPLFADVDRFLRGRGFQFHSFLGYGSRCFKPLVAGGDPNRGLNQWLWTDAVYVRDWSDLAGLSGEKIRKYATIVHDVFGSPDLCHLLLERLDEKEGSGHAKAYAQKLFALTG